MDSLFFDSRRDRRNARDSGEQLVHWQWNGRFPEGFPEPTKIGRRVAYPHLKLIQWAEGQIAKTNGGGPA